MTRVLFLFAACGLAACGVGEAVMGNGEGAPNGTAGLGTITEGSARPDAGSSIPAPLPPEAAPDAGTPPPAPPCPAGQTLVYRYVADAQPNSAARIVQGPGGAPMTVACEASTCTRSVAVVVRSSTQATATTHCVPPPPVCPSGEYANYIPPTNLYESPAGYDPNAAQTPGEWTCTGPCDLLVQYGAMFGTRMVCAPPPPGGCPSGEEPSFIVETEEWQCHSACSGGKYDPTQYEGAAVCVPC